MFATKKELQAVLHLFTSTANYSEFKREAIRTLAATIQKIDRMESEHVIHLGPQASTSTHSNPDEEEPNSEPV